MTAASPASTPVPIGDLRPTQMTVGMREVAEKRKVWRSGRTPAASSSAIT